jgi:hypothetical protein
MEVSKYGGILQSRRRTSERDEWQISLLTPVSPVKIRIDFLLHIGKVFPSHLSSNLNWALLLTVLSVGTAKLPRLNGIYRVASIKDVGRILSGYSHTAVQCSSQIDNAEVLLFSHFVRWASGASIRLASLTLRGEAAIGIHHRRLSARLPHLFNVAPCLFPAQRIRMGKRPFPLQEWGQGLPLVNSCPDSLL